MFLLTYFTYRGFNCPSARAMDGQIMQYYYLIPNSCQFRDRKALLFMRLIHVNSDIENVQTLGTFTAAAVAAAAREIGVMVCLPAAPRVVPLCRAQVVPG